MRIRFSRVVLSSGNSDFVSKLLALICVFPSLLPATNLIVRDVTLIDATGNPARAHMSVAVTGQRITAIGPAASIPIPKGAEIVNGKGKFLIPGLWDMHVHLWRKQSMFPLYIANGVTGVRDMGSNFKQTEVNRGKTIGPRVFTCGRAVMGPDLSPADGERIVNKLDDEDVDFVKVQSNIPRDAYFSLAHRARLLRLPFAGHVPDSVTMAEAIDARQRSMEHLFGIPLACSSEEDELRRQRAQAIATKDKTALDRIAERIYETYSEEKATALFRRFVMFDVWQVPTLTLREKNASKRDFDRCLNLVASMRRANVPMLAGADTGDPYVLPGSALHDELALLVHAGLTPLEAIQSATRNPARFLGLESTLGTIQKGKVADMVLLDANPLADIRNTRQISAVILKGALLTRARLNGLLRTPESVK